MSDEEQTMKKIRVKIIVVVVVLLFCLSAYSDVETAKVLLGKVKDFYMWALMYQEKIGVSRSAIILIAF